MNSVADVDRTYNVSRRGLRLASDPGGTALGAPAVLATGSIGDPVLYMLAGDLRGAAHPIDANRYRIATIEMGLPGPRDVNTGSIARIVWRQKGDTAETVSEDILINHRSGANVLDTISVDMKTLAIEPGAGSPSHTGWTGTIDQFRLDPDEFTPATEFWVRRVKLAALESASSSYRIAWNYDAQNSGATMSLCTTSTARASTARRIDGVSAPAAATPGTPRAWCPAREHSSTCS